MNTLSFNVGGKRVLVDEDDLFLVAQFCWRLTQRYVTTNKVISGKQTTIRLSRLIMNAPVGMQVDHRNRNTLDNRKANLWVCTAQQNSWNVPMRRNNRSGFKGVSLVPPTNRWRATLTSLGRRFHLGYFDKAEDANAAYISAVTSLRGEDQPSARRPDGRDGVPEEGAA